MPRPFFNRITQNISFTIRRKGAIGVDVTAPLFLSANPGTTVIQGTTVTWPVEWSEPGVLIITGPNADLVTVIPIDDQHATCQLNTTDFGSITFNHQVVDTAGNSRSQLVNFTINAPDNWPEIYDSIAAGGAGATGNPAPLSHTVTLGNSMKMLVLVGATGLASGETISSVTRTRTGDTPIALTPILVQNVDNHDGTRSNLVAAFELDNPSVGTQTIQVTRSIGASSARINLRVLVLRDCNLTRVSAVGGYIGLDAATYTTSTITGTANKRTGLLFCCQEERATDPNRTVTAPGWTTNSTYAISASPTVTAVLSRNYTTTDNSAPVVTHTHSTGGDSLTRSLAWITLVYESVPHVELAPIYYFSNEGDDIANNGLSETSTFKSLDKAASLANSLVAGGKILFKVGQRHRRSTRPTYGVHALDITSAGTSLKPCELGTWGGPGKAYISCSEQRLLGWSASSSGETNTVATGLGAEKITLGSYTDYRQMSFPIVGTTMLQPCTWSADKYPGSIHDWECYLPGSDAYTFVPDTQVQSGVLSSSSPGVYNSATFDMNKVVAGKGVVCSSPGGSSPVTWTVRVYDPAIGIHYGIRSPVGTQLKFISANTQIVTAPITAYNQAESWVECTYSGIPNQGPRAVGFYWCIMLHPYDLRKEGQYARVGDDLHAIFGSIVGSRSISAGNRAIRTAGTNWILGDGIVACDTSDDQGDEESGAYDQMWTMEGGPYNCTGTIYCERGINHSRPGAWGQLSDFAVGGIPNEDKWLHNANLRFKTEQVMTYSGFRGVQVRDVNILSARFDEIGRSGVYFAGGSYNNTATNLEIPYIAPVHGNPLTAYQGTYSNTYSKALIPGAFNAIAVQGVKLPNGGTPGSTAKAYPPGKDTDFLNMLVTQARDISTVSGIGNWTINSPLVRVDNDYSGSHMKGIMAFNVKNLGAAISIGKSNDYPAGNQGSVAEQIATDSFGQEVGAGASVTERSIGISNTDGSVYPLSDTMWERLTNNGSGYESVQIGPDSFGWTIPPYHTNFAMIPIKLFGPILRGPWQAGRTLGMLLRAGPQCDISLPAGVDNNDLFFIDRGELVPFAVLPKGTYTITVRQTSTGGYATNGPTYDTQITFTVI